MKKILLLFFSVLTSQLLAQENYATSRAIYHAKHSLANAKYLCGKNTLHFDQYRSLFVHNDYPSENLFTENGTYAEKTKGDVTGQPIFTDLTQKLQFSKRSNLTLEEKVAEIEWQIHVEEQKSIKGFTCIKASGLFAGRQYEAWFSPEIPVSFGPFKLGGLPGLILEAKSSDGKVSWEFVGYEPVTTEPVLLAPPGEDNILTWEEYVAFRLNQVLQTESKSDERGSITVYDPPGDSFIEKDKYNVRERYGDKKNLRQ